MDQERNQRRFESVYSRKIRAGKRRTYFFDVRKTKGEDFYLTLTESTRKFNGDGYERHKIFLYKEDFNRFMDSLQEVVEHIKTELMPEYDYDEFTRRHEEYDAQDFDERDDRGEEEFDDEPVKEQRPATPPAQPSTKKLEISGTPFKEDDMAW
ncbi:DUF3276 family protein [Haliscomenobacter sp.]|uniref:DUF3276 family protein n=1 Tax=Haliscomenobacter sp. TaxID=2717303 RepID=UPI0035938BE0